MPQDSVESFVDAFRGLHLNAPRAWFGGFAARTSDGFELLAARIKLLTPGSTIPDLPAGDILRTSETVAVSGAIELESLDALCSELLDHKVPAALAAQFGVPLVLPGSKNPPTWQFSDDTNARRAADKPAILLNRYASDHLYERIGQLRFERLDDEFKAARPESFDGVAGFVTRLGLTGADDFKSHMARTCFQVSADLCARIASFEYSRTEKAYRAELEVGVGLPLEQGVVGFLPGAHPRLSLTELKEVRRRNGRALLAALLSGPWRDEPLKAALQFTGRTVSECDAQGRKRADRLPFGLPRSMRVQHPADALLRKRFGRTWRQVGTALRRALPASMVRAAMQRMREGLEVLEDRPFYSILASGSVVEALLVIRLRRLGPTRLQRRADKLGLLLPKTRSAEPALSDCIDLVEKLQLMQGLEASGLRAVKDARNHVHLSSKRASHRGFSEADAMSALNCAYGLLDVLTVKGSRTLPPVRASKVRTKAAATP